MILAVQAIDAHTYIKMVNRFFNELSRDIARVIFQDAEIDFGGSFINRDGNVVSLRHVVAIKLSEIQITKDVAVHNQKVCRQIRN